MSKSILKNRKKNISTIMILLLTILFNYQYLFSNNQAEKLATVYSINLSKKEILIASPRAAEILQMGDLVYINVNNKNIILNITFPMQTIAKCKPARSHMKYFSLIKKNMTVFRYIHANTLKDIKNDFERLDAIYLYNGRLIKGVVISRDKKYTILTPKGKIKIDEDDIMNIKVIK